MLGDLNRDVLSRVEEAEARLLSLRATGAHGRPATATATSTATATATAPAMAMATTMAATGAFAAAAQRRLIEVRATLHLNLTQLYLVSRRM